MIQGSNHPRTARSATGQDICGLIPLLSLIFFPRSRSFGRNVCLWVDFRLNWLEQLVRRAGRGAADMIPAKGEGATHKLPMSSDRFVAAYLILGPTQGVFDVF